MASLQLEIHATQTVHVEAIMLLKTLDMLGFSLFYNEPNFICPTVGEFSFINLKLMSKYLSIPYTMAQLKEARSESTRRMLHATGWPGQEVLSAFAFVEKTHYGCNLIRTFQGQRSRVFCETFITAAPPSTPKVAYLFYESLSPQDASWLSSFSKKYGVELHLWSNSPPPSGDDFVAFHHRPLSDAEDLDLLLSSGMVKLMEKLGHKEIAMLFMGTSTTLHTIQNSLLQLSSSEDHFLELSSRFSRPLQLVLGISLCPNRDDHPRLKQAIIGLPKAGFSLLGKNWAVDPQCDFSFTFSI